MKPFSSWVSDMANSIEDESTIVKDEHGNIMAPVPKIDKDAYCPDDYYYEYD